MNQLSGIIQNTKSVDGMMQVHIEVGDKLLSSLILSGEEEYHKEQKVNLIFKETEVMIATCDSVLSARNSFISPITYINTGELLAEVHFDFEGKKIVCVVTKEALQNLKCHVGDLFRWFVKSNEVSIQTLSEA